MKIITISREFGSGGREVGKRPEKEYEKQIREVDRLRAKNHNLLSAYRWGDMRGYDLCLNTSYLEIKKIIPSIAQYAREWFAR